MMFHRVPLLSPRPAPLALLLSLLVLLTVGCSSRPDDPPRLSAPETEAKAAVRVVTSITVLADLVAQVGGERVSVKALVPGGADPNTFQPAPRHVVQVSRANLVFLNGLGLDRTIRTVVTNAARPDLSIVTLSDGLPTLESGLSNPDGANRGNPYLWLDPRRAAVYVERIRDQLAAIDPAGAATYRAGAAAYLQHLQRVDAEVEQQLTAIAPEQRKLVTLHDAFPYLAERYGLQLLAVALKTPGRSPSAQEIADLSRAMRAHEVRTVFVEPQLDARLLKLAARDAGLNIATLYSDTLDLHVPTYEALLRYNARQLVNGLK